MLSTREVCTCYKVEDRIQEDLHPSVQECVHRIGVKAVGGGVRRRKYPLIQEGLPTDEDTDDGQDH